MRRRRSEGNVSSLDARQSAVARLGRRDAAAARLLGLVAAARGVSGEQLLGRTRGPAEIAESRQIAMYLANTLLGRNLTEVGALFGRDRTTVAHACALVEDLRDEPDFEVEMTRLEAAYQQADETGIEGWRHAAGR